MYKGFTGIFGMIFLAALMLLSGVTTQAQFRAAFQGAVTDTGGAVVDLHIVY